MPDNDDEDSTPPVPGEVIGHIDNRQLLGCLGNIVLEQRQHNTTLDSLYRELRGLRVPAPKSWAHKLLEELERHHEKDKANIYVFKGVLQ